VTEPEPGSDAGVFLLAVFFVVIVITLALVIG
jgi:hypothetical protein